MRLGDLDALRAKAQWMEMPDRQGINFDVRAVSVSSIDLAPTIDAVPVVRCKDCKHSEIDDPDFPDQYYCHEGCGWNNGDFYCAYGKRKEADGNDCL